MKSGKSMLRAWRLSRDSLTVMNISSVEGGEGGFHTRTPEASLGDLVRNGITTVVGCIGTDGVGRDMTALLAKAHALENEGMTTYAYTGSYQVPVHTLTDSLMKDIMMLDKVIGVGEVAISDHRSSQPSFEEFARIAADARVAGDAFRQSRDRECPCGRQ